MWSKEPGMTKVQRSSQNITLPKECDLRNQALPMFCLLFKPVIKNINFPKVCGLKNQYDQGSTQYSKK